MKLNRRSFTKRFLGAVGIGAIAPHIWIPKAYGAQCLITDLAGDKCISLSNGCFARPFDIGADWVKMRVGIRCKAGDLGGTLPSLIFSVGLCSGNANQVLDDPTTNFIGYYTAHAYSYTTTYSSASGNVLAKKVGSTVTGSYSTSHGVHYSNHCLIVVEVARGDPNYSIIALFPLVSSSAAATESVFEEKMVNPVLSASGISSTHGATSVQAIAFNEVVGALDHVNIGWGGYETPLYITELAVSRMA